MSSHWLTFPWVTSGSITSRHMVTQCDDISELSVYDAICDTINTIGSENSDRKIMLMMSGGQKSELIFRTSLDTDVHIEPIFLMMHDDLNHHEFAQLEKIDQIYSRNNSTKENPSTQKAWLRVSDWLTGKTSPSWPELVSKHGFADIRSGMLVWLRHAISDHYGDNVCVITGLGELPIYWLSDPDSAGVSSWQISYHYGWDLAYRDYILKHFPQDVPWFWSHTPEIVWSIVSDHNYRERITNQRQMLQGQTALSEVISHNFPHIECRDSYYGLEQFTPDIIDLIKHNPEIDLHNRIKKPEPWPEPYIMMDYHEFFSVLQHHAQK